MKKSVKESAVSKNWNISDEHCTFNDKLTTENFFVLNKNKAVCLICLETVSILKEYNV